MPSQVCLALLELNGVGFSVAECERQKHVMQAKLAALESQAYSLAGHSFSLTSIDDIAQVRCCVQFLYSELRCGKSVFLIQSVNAFIGVISRASSAPKW